MNEESARYCIMVSFDYDAYPTSQFHELYLDESFTPKQVDSIARSLVAWPDIKEIDVFNMPDGTRLFTLKPDK